MAVDATTKKLRWAYLPECDAPPSGWSVAPFTDVCQVIAGQSPPSETYNEKGIGLPFLQGNGDFSEKFPQPQSWCAAPAKVAERGDTLISVRAPVGEVNRAEQRYAIGRGLAAIRTKGANADFVHQAIQRWRWSLQRVAQGTTFDAVTARHFGQLLVAIPDSVDEQAAIARVLDAVDVAIHRAGAALKTAEALDHSILHELLAFGVSGAKHKRKPAHWQLKRVDEVADVGSGVTLGKDVSGFKHVELPYLRVANVQDGHLDLKTIKTVEVRCDEVERYRLEPGDVLMTEGGDLDKLGRGTLWEGQIENCLHQNHIFRIRADRCQLDPRYFAFVVESDIAKRYFTRVAKRTTNLASTNKTQVRALRFPLPPLNEQDQIANIMSASKSRIRALRSKSEALRLLKKSLMHDLLTGTVRVDPVILQQ